MSYISLEMDSSPNNRICIHVRLLDEGTDVSRPTEALDFGNGVFELLPTRDYDAAGETWEFPPGSLVRCEKRVGKAGEYLLATVSVQRSH
jgi:hypothetical protein